MGAGIPVLQGPATPAAHCRMQLKLSDGTQVLIRPIGPQDAEREQAFVRGLSPESRYFRFMNTLGELSPEMLYRFTHPDPAREVALVALTGTEAEARQIAVARCVVVPDQQCCEFAIVVADAFQGKGLGYSMMRALIEGARAAGMRCIEGLVLSTNQRMLALMTALGFDIHTAPGDPRLRRVVKQLHGGGEPILTAQRT